MLRNNFFLTIPMVIGVIFCAFSSPANAHPFSELSGDGTSSTTPFLISSCEQLQLIDSEDGIYLNSYFKLANDIDCATTTTWNEDAENIGTYFGFRPIGSSTAFFSGSLDGDNHYINNLYINRPTEYNVALFAYASSTDNNLVEFKNINFGDIDEEIGKADIEGNGNVSVLGANLIGNVLVDNVKIYSSLLTNGTSYSNRSGNIAAYYSGCYGIINSEARGDIISNGQNTGGIVGRMETKSACGAFFQAYIDNSHFTGIINTENEYVGGLVGSFFATYITNSSASSTITSFDEYIPSFTGGHTGGLVGHFSGYGSGNSFIDNSHFAGSINAEFSYVGGLAGEFYGNYITNSSASSTITSSKEAVAGLVGRFAGKSGSGFIDNSHFTGNVNSEGNYIGGLIGYFSGNYITNSSVSSSSINNLGGSSQTGGLVGNFSGDYINNCNVKANVSSKGSQLAGLVGYFTGTTNESNINNSSFEGVVEVIFTPGYFPGYTAGLVGYFYGNNIKNSFTKGDVFSNGAYSAGLVGYFSEKGNNSIIDNCNFEGNLYFSDSYIAGLVGYFYGDSIVDSYVKADLYSSDNVKSYISNIGGVIGYFSSEEILENLYYEGDIFIEGEYIYGIGGLVGCSSSGDINNSHASSSITIKGTSNGYSYGGLVGYFSGNGDIDKSYFIGSLLTETNNSNSQAGGIAGGLFGNLKNSYAEANISSNSGYVGGLVGFAGGSIIENNYFKGNVKGTNNLGGLIGYGGFDNIKNNYVISDIEIDNSNMGSELFASGLLGYLSRNINLNNNYFSGEFINIQNNEDVIFKPFVAGVSKHWITGLPEYTGTTTASNFWNSDLVINETGVLDNWLGEGVNTGLSTNELKIFSTFSSNWDIANINNHDNEIWYINEGYDYPRLLWENKEYYVKYSAGENGSIIGSSTQIVIKGESATEINAVPNKGYYFISWSDGNESGTRIDRNINSNIILTARFAPSPIPIQSVCQIVEYGDWQTVNPEFNVQYREVASSSPSGCYLTREQREGMERIINNEGGENGDSSSSDDFISVMNRERSMLRNIDRELSNRMAGRILLQVEENGEAWYVDPKSTNKYFMGRPADAFQLMRSFGLGISENNYYKFRDGEVLSRFAGQILLRVENKGEVYYVNPVDMKMHYLGRPADAFRIMRELALGISNDNFRKIQVGQ